MFDGLVSIVTAAGLPMQSLLSAAFWTVIFLVELGSLALLAIDFGYLTARSFVAPEAINYLRHLVVMVASTVLFLLLEALLLQAWTPG